MFPFSLSEEETEEVTVEVKKRSVGKLGNSILTNAPVNSINTLIFGEINKFFEYLMKLSIIC